ncbi:MAG: DUF362 domain-containing protein [Negativicutes bacterium]|nr:DUF362 domain-containing protein [Negativicutes bacterium]
MTKATVYFCPVYDGIEPADQAQKMAHLIDRAAMAELINPSEYVAVKVHVGEKNNTTHVRPEVVREVVRAAQDKGGQVFLTETATLYKGERDNAVRHILHAVRQGFTVERVGAPFIMADGLNGSSEIEVQIDSGQLHRRVKIAREAAVADVLIAISHPTGHMLSGLGATIKNLGMGLASRQGKLRQHAALKPEIRQQSCRRCGKCSEWCPARAIGPTSGGGFQIDGSQCIGCGECVAVCRFDAVKYDWGADAAFMQRSMAEHALAVVAGKGGKCMFFNVMVNMTRDCDCFGVEQTKIIADIGILASTDPVAVDMAAIDLTARANGRSLAALAYERQDAMIQINHAEAIGLGTTDYRLVTV